MCSPPGWERRGKCVPALQNTRDQRELGNSLPKGAGSDELLCRPWCPAAETGQRDSGKGNSSGEEGMGSVLIAHWLKSGAADPICGMGWV